MLKWVKKAAVLSGCLIFVSLFLWQSLAVVHATGGMWQLYVYNGSTGSRPYFVYTPTGYQPDRVLPLMVMLHGCAQTPADFAASTQMNALADQKQFLVVYPEQTSLYNGDECWNWFDAANQERGKGEAALIAGIVQAVEHNTAQWQVDTQRVYVVGMSAGASMAVILGATYPDMFAAIGVHSGVEYKAATTPGDGVNAMLHGGPDPLRQGMLAFAAMGTAVRMVPTIVFQGTADSTVSAINGDQVIQQWMQTDTLASLGTYRASFDRPTSRSSGQVTGGHAYEVERWNDSQGNEVQEYWKVYDMGHAWSGGSLSGSLADPQGPSASLAMYNFFMSNAL